ncbi:MAG TPA: DsrE family protein [Actinomycetota bacterium]|nr:DsrE family protein [Actinomycetota bacterium]
MSSLLVHIHTGPENPTKVALGMLVARTAAAEGHDVSVFFAGDAVNVIRDSVLDSLQGVGTGSAREHFTALVEAGTSIYLSKMSSMARGVTDADIEGKGASWAAPEKLVELTLGHDRVLTY